MFRRFTIGTLSHLLFVRDRHFGRDKYPIDNSLLSNRFFKSSHESGIPLKYFCELVGCVKI